MGTHHEEPRDQDLPELRDELSRLLRPPAVSEGADRAFRAELRGHAGRVRWTAARRQTIRRIAAAAAIIVLVAWFAWRDDGQATETEPVVPVAGDVTGDGVLDVRDAYVIQLALDRGAIPPGQGDHDGDGTTDAGDVRRILDSIVMWRPDR